MIIKVRHAKEGIWKVWKVTTLFYVIVWLMLRLAHFISTFNSLYSFQVSLLMGNNFMGTQKVVASYKDQVYDYHIKGGGYRAHPELIGD